MDGLPKFVVIKSMYNNNCLRYTMEPEVERFLQFSGEEATHPCSKFEIRPANRMGLVHIQCCYNKKYLVRLSPEHKWIVAKAEQPEEDQADWSCTLFQLIFIDREKAEIRFRHVQSMHYACLWWPQRPRFIPPHYGCLCLDSTQVNKDPCDVYKIIDWESLENPSEPNYEEEEWETQGLRVM